MINLPVGNFYIKYNRRIKKYFFLSSEFWGRLEQSILIERHPYYRIPDV